jgi:ribonuclease HI
VDLTIHIDGGARGNPGEAGFGVHVVDAGGAPQAALFGYLGIQTNNVAEYAALVVALRYAAGNHAGSVLIRSDSELLVKQMRGEYRVKSPGLIPMYRMALRLAKMIPQVTFHHVPRARNKEADALANRAMDLRSDDPPGIASDLPLPDRAGIR